MTESRAREEQEETHSLSIKEWKEEDRPREKLLAKGIGTLSNAELLAILIGSGTTRKSAVELMEEVLGSCDNHLSLLQRMSVDDLMAFSGIGQAKALTLIAAAEIARRRSVELVDNPFTKLDSSQKVYALMHPYLADLNHEECWLLLLNNSARLIKRVRLSLGGRTEVTVDVRIVLKHALLAEATAIILVHNHPSGSCRPSQSDRELTRNVKQAAEIMCLRLADHLIVTDGDYYSFNDNGTL